MKKLFVFDFDGTLVDSIGGICAGINYALGQLGQPSVTPQACLRMVGNGARTLCERALPEDRKDLADEMFRLYYGRYMTHCLEDTRVYDGIPGVLRELRQSGGRIAVLSNKPDAQTRLMTEALFPDIPFDLVLGHADTFARKPDPASLRHIMQTLGAAPADTVMIGDSAEDIQTAQAAGVTSVAVSWGFRARPVLEAAAPDYIADDVAQLRGILCQLQEG